MKGEKLFIVSLVLFAFLISFSLASALTASIDKPKMVLYKNITSEELQFQESVIVNNNNNEPITITITPTGEWKGKVTIEDSSNNFILEKNQIREVFYTITINKAGEYSGDIIITFKDSNQTEVSLAQRLVVKVQQGESKFNWSYILITLAIAILLIIILIYLARRRKK